MSAHRVRWYARTSDGEFLARTRLMRDGDWGWDARCSCGWETRTGGAIAARIREAIWAHRFLGGTEWPGTSDRGPRATEERRRAVRGQGLEP